LAVFGATASECEDATDLAWTNVASAMSPSSFAFVLRSLRRPSPQRDGFCSDLKD